MEQKNDMTKQEKKMTKSIEKVEKKSATKPKSEPELRLVNVNKSYKLSNKESFQALHDLNAEFFKGELVSIVGESGSGKSTLMNLIGGLDSDFTGDIISGGQNLRELSDKELDKYRKNQVGFVFQSFNLISHLSILDNVTLSLTLSNVAEKEKVERATKILERVGLKEHLKKKPTQLSGGQKQRVAIARALINDPEIIIADEPTGALDSQTSMQILEILKEIADNGKLVIMVTHSEKVASISSRVVEISDGRIVGDHKNEKYKKNKNVKPINLVEKEEVPAGEIDVQVKNLEETSSSVQQDGKKKKRKNFREYKNKQNLSFRSAIRLSLHNMWASKTKNFLMAFGVAIGIGSLILMMCFSTGITDFIDDTMKSYSDPNIATIRKLPKGLDMALDSIMNGFIYNGGFEDGDLKTLLEGYVDETNPEEPVVHEGLNNYLKRLYEEKKVKTLFQIPEDMTDEAFSPGLFMLTSIFNGKVVYNPEQIDVDYSKNEELLSNNLKNGVVSFLYTTPPYYTDTKVIEGEMSTKDGGIMLSKEIYDILQTDTIYDENGDNIELDIYFEFPDKPPFDFRQKDYNLELTGVMDTSVISGITTMYIDYEYFQKLCTDVLGEPLTPNVLYLHTPSEEITDAINDYIKTVEVGRYTTSIEMSIGGMFNNMTSVIGTSLIVISCISLLVSAMMILVVLYMSVTERTKEIGVLKSIGARRKDIKRIFTSESFLIGLLSGVVGILFNFLLTFVVWLILTSTIGMAPISYRWYYFVIAIGVAVLISMLSGLYPASKAAKLDPVESLRRE